MPESPLRSHVIFAGPDLIPRAWRNEPDADRFYVWNPSIAWLGDHYVMAYRVTTPHYTSRRIAACRLDRSLRIVPGSITPLSDTIQCPQPAFSDPRLVWLQGRLFMHFFNANIPNLPFLVELNAGGLAARSPARPLVLQKGHRHTEKNWMLFDHEGEVWAIYTIAPHLVLRLDMKQDGPIACHPAFRTEWDVERFARHYGYPRGGSPPVRLGDRYYAFFHSFHLTDAVHRAARIIRQCLRLGWPGPRGSVPERSGSPERGRSAVSVPDRVMTGKAGLRRFYHAHIACKRYVGGFYAFAAEPPFAPCFLVPEPVLLPEDEPPRMRPDPQHAAARKVVFPDGAVLTADQQWVVAYGIHNERCGIRSLPHDRLLLQGKPVVATTTGEDHPPVGNHEDA